MRAFLTTLGTRWAFLWATVTAVYAAAIVVLDIHLVGPEQPVTEAALALGTGLLLGLRVNRAYERWWEGRKLWGTLVNVSRNLAVKIRAFARPEPEQAREVATEIAAFAFALNDHLRDGARLREVPGFESREENPGHVPVWIVGRLYERIRGWSAAGRVTPEEMRTIDREARVLLDVCGACERIRNTLMPPSLAALTRLVMGLTLLGLPIALDEHLGWWTVPASAGAAFFLVVAESTATVIERPFGRDPNELDLDRLCVVIRDTTAEALLGPVSSS